MIIKFLQTKIGTGYQSVKGNCSVLLAFGLKTDTLLFFQDGVGSNVPIRHAAANMSMVAPLGSSLSPIWERPCGFGFSGDICTSLCL